MSNDNLLQASNPGSRPPEEGFAVAQGGAVGACRAELGVAVRQVRVAHVAAGEGRHQGSNQLGEAVQMQVQPPVASNARP